jgi:UDP-N-acetylmuramoylalanine--D-glutamate ligase
MTQALLNQHVLILGLGISGLSMVRWCLRQGAKVTAVDTREAPPALADFKALQATHTNLIFKTHALTADLIEGTDIRAVFKSQGLSPAAVAPVWNAAKTSGLWLGNELTLFNHALRELKVLQGYAPKILGVTGTNGKTTVTSLAGQLVARAGKTVAVAGNIDPALLDTLGLHLDVLAQKQTPLPQVWALELASYQLDGVDDFEPTAATVLNLTQDHLDWHGDMTAYAAAKENIYGKNKKQTQILFSTGMPTQVNAYGLEDVAGMTWLVRSIPESDAPQPKVRKGETASPVPFIIQRLMPASALRIRGLHNATNALAALALAARAGCSLAPMLYGLREYRGEPHRMESVAMIDGVEYIDDSKGTNVGATVAALNSLGADTNAANKIVVILGGDGKGQDFAPLLAPIQKYAKAAILIGRDAKPIKAAIANAQKPTHHTDTLPAAVALGAGLTEEGDVVLLSPACASFDMFSSYKHRAEVFVQAVHELAAQEAQLI